MGGSVYRVFDIVLVLHSEDVMSERQEVDFERDVLVNWVDGCCVEVDAMACPSDTLLPCSCSNSPSPSSESSSRRSRTSVSSGVDDLRKGDGFLGFPTKDDVRDIVGLRSGEREMVVGVSTDMLCRF
jgi:hypothetical protein